MRTKLALYLLLMAAPAFLYAQDVKTQLSQASYAGISSTQADSVKKAILNAVFSRPELFNDAYAKFLSSYIADSSSLYTLLKDLNLKFKTFQANGQPAALGFEYNYQNNWTKSYTTPSFTGFQTYSLTFNGNVAFNKIYNPDNFLVSAFNYNASWMWGGKVKRLDTASRNRLLALDKAIIQANLAGNNTQLEQLYVQRGSLIKTTNQYYIGINGNFNYETNQQFSKRQFVPGVLVNLGAKAWDKDEALRYFNLPDYPFALLRLITGTDKTFNISGASFPSALLGVDHVIPDQDSLRHAVTGNLNAYNRFRFESGFKTEAARFGNQVVYCSADFRWYRELFAPGTVQRAGIASFTYFGVALEATNGFFISYVSGRLPFDIKPNNVYAIGFHYDFGN